MKTLLIGYTSVVAFLAISIVSAILLPEANQLSNALVAETNGSGKGYYCRLMGFDFDRKDMKTCNYAVGGFLGTKKSFEIGPRVTLDEATVPNPVDTRCSVVQWDGKSPGDLHVQYSVDASNYCRYDYEDGDYCIFNGDVNNKKPFNDANRKRLRTLFDQSCVAATVTPTTKPTSTPLPVPTTIPTSTPTLKPTLRPTLRPTLVPDVCKERKTVTFFNNELLVAGPVSKLSKSDNRSPVPGGIKLVNQSVYTVNLADSRKFIGDPDNLRFKYEINLIPMWGWRGDVNDPIKQTNESHYVNLRSGIALLGHYGCYDWGNANGYTDGVRFLQSVEKSNPISSSPHFRNCINEWGPAMTPKTLPNGGKIRITQKQIKDNTVKVVAAHVTEIEQYRECVKQNPNNKDVCRGSHYSMLKVDYCVKEGRAK